jgi:hypothetical protein
MPTSCSTLGVHTLLAISACAHAIRVIRGYVPDIDLQCYFWTEFWIYQMKMFVFGPLSVGVNKWLRILIIY